MLIEATTAEADAIVRAMSVVASARGTAPLTAADRSALVGAHRLVFRRLDHLDVDALQPIETSELAGALADSRLREHCVDFLAVMSTVDGSVDTAKIAVVEEFATALEVRDAVVGELADAAAGRLQAMFADMSRINLESITGGPMLVEDVHGWLLPYDAAPDAGLQARYRSLAGLADGTFGRAFHDFYAANGFAFPGGAGAINEIFATPHDSVHLLSGYSTTPQGELLVSTFTAGMHPDEPLAGHILPVIFSWHIGLAVNDIAGKFVGALDPEKFWYAWSRGSALAVDVFDPLWDFWATTPIALDEVRERFVVPPLDPAMAADDRPPSWYTPTA